MELVYSREFVELLLVKEGFSLRDITGETEVHRVEEPRTDLRATLARVSPRTLRRAEVGTLALGLLAAVETALWTPLAVAIAVALSLHALDRLEPPRPVTKTHKVRRGGLTERKVMRYLTMANTLGEMEEEAREDARREAERQSSSNGGL